MSAGGKRGYKKDGMRMYTVCGGNKKENVSPLLPPPEWRAEEGSVSSNTPTPPRTAETGGGPISGGAFADTIYNSDDVSLALANGTIADPMSGNDKAVATNIQLAGTKAGNYALAQPTDVKVNITGNAPGEYMIAFDLNYESAGTPPGKRVPPTKDLSVAMLIDSPLGCCSHL